MTHKFIKIIVATIVFRIVASASPVVSPAILALTTHDSPIVIPLSHFSIDTYLCVWLGQSVAIDYKLSLSPSFTMVSRDITVGDFTDSVVINPGPTQDQGALVSIVSQPSGPGIYWLAHFILQAPANTGDYLISAYDVNVVGTAPGFEERPPDRIDPLLIHVAVPDPNWPFWILLLICLLALRRNHGNPQA